MQATRADLETTLARLRELAGAKSKPASLAAETTYIQTRLENGDFHVGDRVLLVEEDPLPFRATGEPAALQGKSQEQLLSDTFTVQTGPQLMLPVVGSVSLHGVLRSELEPVLTQAIARYIKDPALRARSLVSVGVIGEVARPGYYSVPPDAVLAAVLTTAGGPTKDAILKEASLERNGKSLRTVYRATPLGRKALTSAKSKLRELFGELIEGPGGAR